jgi:outer membrane protein OmpA-like peptidoglycan-associated protein
MRHLTLIFASFLTFTLSAQDFIMKRDLANRYYDRFDYYKAIPMYEQLLNAYPRNYEVTEKLADSYRRINDRLNAERCYALLVDTSAVKPEYLLYYAEALAANGKYDLSGKWYQKYAEAKPDDNRGHTFSKAYQNVRSFYIDSASFSIRKEPFNSEKSDFAPTYYKNGLIFASARKQIGIIRVLYNWTYSSYLDLYFAEPESSDAHLIEKGINTIYHEGPVTFYPGENSIIFTRSNFYHLHFRKDNAGVNKLKLFQANFDTACKCWKNTIPLPFNNDQYSVGHPALSPDGKTLYFASDMPNGFGGTDIYVSHLSTDSTGKKVWGKAENLGEEINTPGNEMFPYIDPDGNLWFTSNGLPGLGGLDIFEAKKAGTEFAKPVNPGYPINTRFDDFSYITRNNGKDGFMSSDRYNQIGNDDIFRVRRISQNIVLKVVDAKTQKSIAKARIYIKTQRDSNNYVNTDAKGLSPLVMSPSLNYQFIASSEKYLDSLVYYTFDNLSQMDTLTIGLIKKVPKFEFKGRVYSEDNKEPYTGVNAVLETKSDTAKQRININDKGEFSFRLDTNKDYTVSIDMAGRRCSTNPINFSTTNMETDYVFIGNFPVFCVGDVIKLENIYYDLGKYNIRPQAALELNKLYDIMMKYPKMKIELRSHTDSRGSDAANMTLSENRAKAATDYLVKKGISRDRIIGKGYGETEPLNRCTNGVKCTEEEYQVNRRTEFKILSVE